MCIRRAGRSTSFQFRTVRRFRSCADCFRTVFQWLFHLHIRLLPPTSAEHILSKLRQIHLQKMVQNAFKISVLHDQFAMMPHIVPCAIEPIWISPGRRERAAESRAAHIHFKALCCLCHDIISLFKLFAVSGWAGAC